MPYADGTLFTIIIGFPERARFVERAFRIGRQAGPPLFEWCGSFRREMWRSFIKYMALFSVYLSFYCGLFTKGEAVAPFFVNRQQHAFNEYIILFPDACLLFNISGAEVAIHSLSTDGAKDILYECSLNGRKVT